MTKISYFYRPLDFYNRRVLKCAGIVTADNRQWLKAEHPEGIELDGYRGDRIRASDHTNIAQVDFDDAESVFQRSIRR
jgi:hypothetical protein